MVVSTHFQVSLPNSDSIETMLKKQGLVIKQYLNVVLYAQTSIELEPHINSHIKESTVVSQRWLEESDGGCSATSRSVGLNLNPENDAILEKQGL